MFSFPDPIPNFFQCCMLKGLESLGTRLDACITIPEADIDEGMKGVWLIDKSPSSVL